MDFDGATDGVLVEETISSAPSFCSTFGISWDVGNGGRIYSLMSNDVEYSLMYGVSTDVTDLVTVVDNEGLTDVGTLIEGEPLADTDKDIILELETLEDIVIDNVIEDVIDFVIDEDGEGVLLITLGDNEIDKLIELLEDILFVIDELIDIDSLGDGVTETLLDGEFVDDDVGDCETEILDVGDSDFDVEGVLDGDDVGSDVGDGDCDGDIVGSGVDDGVAAGLDPAVNELVGVNVFDDDFDVEGVLDADGEIEEVIDSLWLTDFVGESVILALVDGDCVSEELIVPEEDAVIDGLIDELKLVETLEDNDIETVGVFVGEDVGDDEIETLGDNDFETVDVGVFVGVFVVVALEDNEIEILEVGVDEIEGSTKQSMNFDDGKLERLEFETIKFNPSLSLFDDPPVTLDDIDPKSLW